MAPSDGLQRLPKSNTPIALDPQPSLRKTPVFVLRYIIAPINRRKLWLEVCKRRWEAVESGQSDLVDAQSVLAEAKPAWKGIASESGSVTGKIDKPNRRRRCELPADAELVSLDYT